MLFGGVGLNPAETTDIYFDDTWEWDDATGTWAQVVTPTMPPPRTLAAMDYDPNIGHVIMQGGYYYTGETWAFDGTDWSIIDSDAPGDRYWHGMVFDQERGRTVLFGGLAIDNLTMFGDTWKSERRRMGQRHANDPLPAHRRQHGLRLGPRPHCDVRRQHLSGRFRQRVQLRDVGVGRARLDAPLHRGTIAPRARADGLRLGPRTNCHGRRLVRHIGPGHLGVGRQRLGLAIHGRGSPSDTPLRPSPTTPPAARPCSSAAAISPPCSG